MMCESAVTIRTLKRSVTSILIPLMSARTNTSRSMMSAISFTSPLDSCLKTMISSSLQHSWHVIRNCHKTPTQGLKAAYRSCLANAHAPLLCRALHMKKEVVCCSTLAAWQSAKSLWQPQHRGEPTPQQQIAKGRATA